MKIHPEVKEMMTEAMTEGLKHYKSKTPEQISAAVRAGLMAESKVLRTPTKGIAWREEIDCTCPTHPFISGHMPWCDGVKRIVFFTPEPELPVTTRDTFYGESIFKRWEDFR